MSNTREALKAVAELVTGLLLLLLFFAVGLGWLMLMLVTKYPLLYTLLIAAGYFSLVGVYVFWLKKNKKALKICALVFFALCLSGTARLTYVFHIDAIPELGEEASTWNYLPFREDSRAARLDSPATLSLAEPLPRLDGATALYPLYAAFAQAVYPPGDYGGPGGGLISCSKTPAAYENLLAGKADVIFCAAPSDEQLELAKKSGKQLRLTPIGKEAFVFFVNKKNPVAGVTVEQIIDLYSGKITNWQPLGGKNQPIRVFQRPKNSGSQTMLEKIMDGAELLPAATKDVVAGMGGIIEQTADYKNYRNALGYSFLFFATRMVQNGDIRLLAINGVFPAAETIRNGTYPFADNFYAVTCGSETPQTRALIDWILSSEGQLLVEKTGYVPLQSVQK